MLNQLMWPTILPQLSELVQGLAFLYTDTPNTYQISRLGFSTCVLVQRAILSPFFRLETTAPFTRFDWFMCSPTSAISYTKNELINTEL